jgi:hypothetical protein
MTTLVATSTASPLQNETHAASSLAGYHSMMTVYTVQEPRGARGAFICHPRQLCDVCRLLICTTDHSLLPVWCAGDEAYG